MLSHPGFHKKKLDLIINILLNNGYLLDFIFNHIKNRLRVQFDHLRRVSTNNKQSLANNKLIKFFLLFRTFLRLWINLKDFSKIIVRYFWLTWE